MARTYSYSLEAVAKIEKKLGVKYSQLGTIFAEGGAGLSAADMAFLIEEGSGKPFTGTAPEAFKELLKGVIPALIPQDVDEAEEAGE